MVSKKPGPGGDIIPGQAARPERWSVMTLTNTALDNLLKSCDRVQRLTIPGEGYMHSSCRCFDACMRSFTGQLPARSVTFRVFFNAPVMKPGYAKFFSDGHVEFFTTDPDA